MQAVEPGIAAPSDSVPQQSITVALQQPPTSTPSEVLQTERGGPPRALAAEEFEVEKLKVANSPNQSNAVMAADGAPSSCQLAKESSLELPTHSESSRFLGIVEQPCLAQTPLPVRQPSLPHTSLPTEPHTPKDAVACANLGMGLVQQRGGTVSTMPAAVTHPQQPSTLLSDFRRAVQEQQRAGPVAQAGHLEQAGGARTPNKQASARSVPATVSREALLRLSLIHI